VTLRCECGGVVEVQDGTYPSDSNGRPSGRATETYECVSCGRTGGMSFGDGPTNKWGCLSDA
jgi:hypothetical protein